MSENMIKMTGGFIDNSIVKKIVIKNEIIKNEKLKDKIMNLKCIKNNILNSQLVVNTLLNKNNASFKFNNYIMVFKDKQIFFNNFFWEKILDEISDEIIINIILNEKFLNEIMLNENLINEILYINTLNKYTIQDEFVIYSLIPKQLISDEMIFKKFQFNTNNIEKLIINILIKNKIIIIKNSKKILLKFSKIIYISLLPKIFIKNFNKIIKYTLNNKQFRLYYYKWIYLIFFLKNNIVNIAIFNKKIDDIAKHLKFFFLKNNVYAYYFYNYHFHIIEFTPCFIKTIFYLRNITLIFKNKFLFKFFTLGLITLNKKSKSNIIFLNI